MDGISYFIGKTFFNLLQDLLAVKGNIRSETRTLLPNLQTFKNVMLVASFGKSVLPKVLQYYHGCVHS